MSPAPPRAAFAIRDEAPSDAAAVRDVVTRAFERSDEAGLVDVLRAAGKARLALVAEQHGRMVGHALFSPVTLDGAPFGLGLAPVAVVPESQRGGIGGALVRAGLVRCRTEGVATVVVLGDPVYYGRLGFAAADRHGLTCEYDGPPGAFQVIELAPGVLAGRSGLVRYAPEFAAV